ncbi:MAG: NADH-quinone oxidoreductase subunit NuoB [Sedimentisphaerales bacterium]|nr:NADH-quinone oxidoreductase subunit NuoB [Sedimentisphaerales bacterium]
MGLKTWALKKSIWLYHANVGACNNCDIEVVDCLTPRYDVERFGMMLAGSPRHADALLVTGICTRQARPRLQELYLQMAKPALVLCIGSCACTGGIFRTGYHFDGPVDEVIREVDPDAIIAYVPGCPPKPEAIIAGAVKALSAIPD